MRWLVTGGAGFIGSHFIDHLLTDSYSNTVWCYDLLTYAGNQDFVHPDATFVRGDIRSREHFSDVLKRSYPDVVVNFAAESHVDNSYSQVGLFTDTNVNGVGYLLESIRMLENRPLFVQISTDEVYGDAQHVRSADVPLHPQNPYAASKAAAEFMVGSFARSFELPTMITRSSNNWGPRQHPEKFLPAAILAKRSGKPMTVHGYEYSRDWLNVQDNVKAIYQLIMKAGEGTWNISTGTQHTLGEMLEKIGDVPHRLSPDRPGVDSGYWVDSHVTWSFLGWEPRNVMDDDRWDDYVASESFETEDVR